MGQQTSQIRAAHAIPILLELAIKKQVITYGKLAQRLGMSNPRHTVGILSLANEVVAGFFEKQAPDICVLVVSAASQIPGDGFISSSEESRLPVSKQAYLALELKDKRRIIEQLQSEVFAYPHWKNLLPLARNFCRYSV